MDIKITEYSNAVAMTEKMAAFVMSDKEREWRESVAANSFGTTMAKYLDDKIEVILKEAAHEAEEDEDLWNS